LQQSPWRRRFIFGAREKAVLRLPLAVFGTGGIDPDFDDIENAELDALERARQAKDDQP
jgi:hypothetical protein